MIACIGSVTATGGTITRPAPSRLRAVEELRVDVERRVEVLADRDEARVPRLDVGEPEPAETADPETADPTGLPPFIPHRLQYPSSS